MFKIPKQEYTAGFKDLAVKRVKSGQSIGSVAQELGLVEQTLRNWVKAAKAGKLQHQWPNRKRLTYAQLLALIQTIHREATPPRLDPCVAHLGNSLDDQKHGNHVTLIRLSTTAHPATTISPGQSSIGTAGLNLLGTSRLRLHG